VNPGVPKRERRRPSRQVAGPLADLRPVLENGRKFCARRGPGLAAERKFIRDKERAEPGGLTNWMWSERWLDDRSDQAAPAM
jgi:hypothetical protein